MKDNLISKAMRYWTTQNILKCYYPAIISLIIIRHSSQLSGLSKRLLNCKIIWLEKGKISRMLFLVFSLILRSNNQ